MLTATLLAGVVLAGCRSSSSRPAEPSDESTGIAPTTSVLAEDSTRALQRDFELMASTGAHWVRFDFDWSGAEPKPGSFDWRLIDRLVRAARAQHLGILATVAYTPAWARPEGTTDKAPPTDPAAFANFARAAASRYAQLGVHHWELWNEPNVTAFWEPAPNPTAYAALLKASAGAVRSADPAATIISAGLAPGVDRSDGATVSPRTFLRGVYDAGGGPAFDAVGIHPYSYPDPPLTPGPDNTFFTLPDTYQVMVDHGDGAKRIWGTEFGAPTGSSERAVTGDQQADRLREGYDQWRRWSFTGPLFWYSHRDKGTDQSDPEDNFGLVTNIGHPKPTLAALRAVTLPARQPRPRP